MYQLELDIRAQKDLDHLQGAILRRIFIALGALRTTPRPTGSRKLQAAGDTYRLRIGDYRVIYSIDDAARALKVLRVLHRRDAYRKFAP